MVMVQVLGSHLSVVATLLRGNYDAKLDWPFEGDIRVELLNWKVDKSHHSNTILFNRYNDPDGTSTSRVTEQKTATGLIRAQFISHTALVPTENTEYLLEVAGQSSQCWGNPPVDGHNQH